MAPFCLHFADMATKTLEEILADTEGVVVEPALNRLMDVFLAGILKSYGDDPNLEERLPFNIAVAALFDLCVNALYARNVETAGWVYCADKSEALSNPRFEGDYLYYPFLGACPRCSVEGRFHRAKPKKPPSDTIGSVNSIVIAALYERVAQASEGKARVLRVPGQGDADLVFVEGGDGDIQKAEDVCVAEIKASPLVSYPLAISTDTIAEADPETGERRVLDHRESDAAHLSKESVYLYLPHKDEYIDLGFKSDAPWPLESLAEYASERGGAAKIAEAWSHLFQLYSNKKLRRSDNAWYLVNSCGSAPKSSGGFSISDGKNMPGIDRTDDLKKGTYQVLKMGAALKDRPDKKVRAALVGNVHAVLHDEVYVEDLADVVWTKDGDDDNYIESRDDEKIVVKTEGMFNLYDGIICITHSRFRDEWLKRIADVESLRGTRR